MDNGFWGKLKKPFFALAPMDDVTDYPFGTMFVKCGKPAVMWTEFVSADGHIALAGDSGFPLRRMSSRRTRTCRWG